MLGDFVDTLKRKAGAPSDWLLLSSIAGAVASVFHVNVPIDLVELGVIVSGFFKGCEAFHSAHVTGKKLDVEKQFIESTCCPSPAIHLAAKAANVPVYTVPPSSVPLA
jgi:hypothetical protein